MYTFQGWNKHIPPKGSSENHHRLKSAGDCTGNVTCLEGIPVKLVKVYVYKSGYIMVYMRIWYVCKYLINYMISEDDTYLCDNMIPHTVGLRKEPYFIQIQYLFDQCKKRITTADFANFSKLHVQHQISGHAVRFASGTISGQISVSTWRWWVFQHEECSIWKFKCIMYASVWGVVEIYTTA